MHKSGGSTCRGSLITWSTFLLLTLALLLSACSDDAPADDGNGACQLGTLCSCTTSLDCPSPEVCGSALMCVPATTGEDAGGDPDTDAAEDSVEDSQPDGTPDETPDESTDEDSSTDEGSPDEDSSTDGDAEELDESDPDEDAELDADPDEDTGSGLNDDYNPWIAYTTVESALGQLTFVRADGTGMAGYDNRDLLEETPAWSPDGLKIAFITGSASGKSLVVIDFSAETVLPETIPTSLDAISSPAWSHDGTMLAISGGTGGGADRIYTIDLQSDEGPQELTTPSNGDGLPVWGIDDEIVYFHRLVASASEIYEVPAAGGTAEALTSGAQVTGRLTLHPDGRTLVFNSAGSAKRLSVDGGRLSAFGRAAQDRHHGFFRAGTKMAVVRVVDGTDGEIVVLDVDSGDLIIRLTTNDVGDSWPVVSPIDSSEIDPTIFR